MTPKQTRWGSAEPSSSTEELWLINGSSPGPPCPEPTCQRSPLSLQVTARMLPTALLAAQVGAESSKAVGSPFGTPAALASLLCPLRSSSPGVWGHTGMGSGPAKDWPGVAEGLFSHSMPLFNFEEDDNQAKENF